MQKTLRLTLQSRELHAGLLTAKKQNEEAKKLYAQGAKEEKALGYHEPPAYVRPVPETEAASFMAAADWTAAKVAYKKALVDRLRTGFPLYGIAMVRERSGDSKSSRDRVCGLHVSLKIRRPQTSANRRRPRLPRLSRHGRNQQVAARSAYRKVRPPISASSFLCFRTWRHKNCFCAYSLDDIEGLSNVHE